jgi:hypothetical protein
MSISPSSRFIAYYDLIFFIFPCSLFTHRNSTEANNVFLKLDEETPENTTEVGLAFLRQIRTTRDKK